MEVELGRLLFQPPPITPLLLPATVPTAGAPVFRPSADGALAVSMLAAAGEVEVVTGQLGCLPA